MAFRTKLIFRQRLFSPLVEEERRRQLINFIDGSYLRSMCSWGAGCCKGSSSAAADAHPPSGNTAQQLAEANRRWLLPRSIHGGRPFPVRSMYSDSTAWCQSLYGGAAAADPPNGNTTSQLPCAKPAPAVGAEREWAYRQITEIETTKHQLFYLLAEMDKRYPGRRYTSNNKELIHHLFRHVEPNPSDPLWRYTLGRERLNNCVIYGMPTLMATWMYLDWESWRNTFAFLLGIGH